MLGSRSTRNSSSGEPEAGTPGRGTRRNDKRHRAPDKQSAPMPLHRARQLGFDSAGTPLRDDRCVELFSFSIKSFSKERRDVAERRVKALGIVEGFNVNRRKTKERKDQKTKETTRQTSLSPGSRGAQPISRNALSGPINFCIDCSRTCVDA
jgi:hypothetical protein